VTGSVTGFTTVGKVQDHPSGQLRLYEVDGRRVAVAATGEGWFAFDDECTHRGCSLAEGELEGTEVECICHGSVFDVTSGEVRNGPAEDPVATFRVRAEGDDLQVSV
jgi:3-phenylpropionate/trans-cinnamate dioxygenase ferredoxin component